jgi:hypothetical protein
MNIISPYVPLPGTFTVKRTSYTLLHIASEFQDIGHSTPLCAGLGLNLAEWKARELFYIEMSAYNILNKWE